MYVVAVLCVLYRYVPFLLFQNAREMHLPAEHYPETRKGRCLYTILMTNISGTTSYQTRNSPQYYICRQKHLPTKQQHSFVNSKSSRQ